MKHIDETQLETELQARYNYLAEFLDFNDEDIAAIHASVGLLAPLISDLVDRTYDKLLSYDATARHFIPRQHGFAGATPEALADLTRDHAQIQFRKEHLTRYLMQLVGHAYNEKMVVYLDMVGKMHTDKAGNAAIIVPLVQMNALMGLLAGTLTETILELDLDPDTKTRTLRAFQKLMWIQNDFITRHYAA